MKNTPLIDTVDPEVATLPSLAELRDKTKAQLSELMAAIKQCNDAYFAETCCENVAMADIASLAGRIDHEMTGINQTLKLAEQHREDEAVTRRKLALVETLLATAEKEFAAV